MTTRAIPTKSSDDLPRVDPPAQVSRPVRAFAAFLTTGLGRWVAKNIAPKVDPWLLLATRGRLSMGLMLPSALITTIGAKTGQPRTNPVFYFHDGPDVIVIASNYGNDTNPAWYYNVKANRRVQIATNGGGPELIATEIREPAERKRLWAMADRVYPLWPDYRRRAARCDRTIPIIRLRAATT
jgi:deazaflavin-dependent oxidoreductase (nitroreductase family)